MLGDLLRHQWKESHMIRREGETGTHTQMDIVPSVNLDVPAQLLHYGVYAQSLRMRRGAYHCPP